MDSNPLACFLALEYKALSERLDAVVLEQQTLFEENRLLKNEIERCENYETELELRMGAMEATLCQLLNYYPLGTKKDTVSAMQAIINGGNYLSDDLERIIAEEVETDEELQFEWNDWFPEFIFDE